MNHLAWPKTKLAWTHPSLVNLSFVFVFHLSIEDRTILSSTEHNITFYPTINWLCWTIQRQNELTSKQTPALSIVAHCQYSFKVALQQNCLFLLHFHFGSIDQLTFSLEVHFDVFHFKIVHTNTLTFGVNGGGGDWCDTPGWNTKYNYLCSSSKPDHFFH